MKRLNLLIIITILLVVSVIILNNQALIAHNIEIFNIENSTLNNSKILVTINGLKEGDEATLTLSTQTNSQNNGLIINETIVGGKEKSIYFEIPINLKDDNYQLFLDAPDEYFREPKGYFFLVKYSEIINPTGKPILFDLIPPDLQTFKPYRGSLNNPKINTSEIPSSSTYMIERIISLSAPLKQPEPENGEEAILSTGYHYIGPSTYQNNEGIWGRFGVVNPGVRHGGGSEFVADRIYLRRFIDGVQHWMEIGWAEVSWETDSQYMYEFDSVDKTWNLYSLPTGSTLEVAIIPDQTYTTKWYSLYQSGGNWYTVRYKDLGFSTADDAMNRGEVYTVFGDHPDLPSVTTDMSYLFVDGNWDNWDSWYWFATSTSNDSPYDTHYYSNYYYFYIHKHS